MGKTNTAGRTIIAAALTCLLAAVAKQSGAQPPPAVAATAEQLLTIGARWAAENGQWDKLSEAAASLIDNVPEGKVRLTDLRDPELLALLALGAAKVGDLVRAEAVLFHDRQSARAANAGLDYVLGLLQEARHRPVAAHYFFGLAARSPGYEAARQAARARENRLPPVDERATATADELLGLAASYRPLQTKLLANREQAIGELPFPLDGEALARVRSFDVSRPTVPVPSSSPLAGAGEAASELAAKLGARAAAYSALAARLGSVQRSDPETSQERLAELVALGRAALDLRAEAIAHGLQAAVESRAGRTAAALDERLAALRIDRDLGMSELLEADAMRFSLLFEDFGTAEEAIAYAGRLLEVVWQAPLPLTPDRDSRCYVDRAQDELKKRNYTGALDTVRRALAADPRNANAYNEFAAALIDSKVLGTDRLTLAVVRVLYTTALRIDPLLGVARRNKARFFRQLPADRRPPKSTVEGAEEAFERGERSFSRRDLEGARRHYEDAIAKDPRHVLAHLYLGDVHYARGEFQEALPHYAQAVGLAPRFRQAQRFYVDAVRKAGTEEGMPKQGRKDPLGERALLWRTVRAQPSDAEAWCRLGEAYLADGLLLPARYAFGEAVERAEGDLLLRALNGFAWATGSEPAREDYFRQVAVASYESEDFRRLLTLDPDELFEKYQFVIPPGTQARASLLNVQLLSRAMAELPATYSLPEGDRSQAVLSALEAYEAKDYRAASRHMQGVITDGPRDGELCAFAGLAALRSDQFHLAMAYFTEALLFGVSDPQVWVWAAASSALAGDLPGSIKAFEGAEQLGSPVASLAELQAWQRQIEALREPSPEGDPEARRAEERMGEEDLRYGIQPSRSVGRELSAAEYLSLVPPMEPIVRAPDREAKREALRAVPSDARWFLGNMFGVAIFFFEKEGDRKTALLYAELERENADALPDIDPPKGYAYREHYQAKAALNTGTLLLNSGEYLESSKALAEAWTLFERAEERRTGACLLPPYSERVNRVDLRAGAWMRRVDVARILGEKVPELPSRTSTTFTPYELETKNQMVGAGAATSLGKYDEAFRLLSSVLVRSAGLPRISQTLLRADAAQQFGAALNQAGLHHLARINLSAAEALNGLPGFNVIAGEGRSPGVRARTYGELGRAEEGLGNHDQAVEAYEKALRNALRSPQPLTAKLSADDTVAPELTWRVLQDLGSVERLRAARIEDPGERGKGVARALARHRQAIEIIESARRKLTAPELRTSERARLGYLRERSAPYESAVGILADRALAEGEEEAIRAAFEYVERAKSQVLVELLNEREMIAPGGSSALAVERLVELLRDQQAVLLEYYATADRVYAWCVGGDQGWKFAELRDRGKPLQPKAVETAALAFARSVSTEATPFEVIADEAARLSELLVPEPFRAAIRAARTVILVPHGSLHLAPFRVLPVFQKLSGQGPALAVAPSASLVAALLARPGPDRSAEGLVFGALNPTGDNSLVVSRQESALPALFRSPPSQYTARADARDVIDALRSFDYVHVFTHGYFDLADPLNSFLQMSDARLTAADVYRSLDRGPTELARARFVSLAACETGKGQILTGDEVLGLPRAFLHAGVGALLTTLWRTNPHFTDRLMTRLYERLAAGEPASTALEEALAEVRRLDRRYEHPFYWGAFVLVGDPR